MYHSRAPILHGSTISDLLATEERLQSPLYDKSCVALRSVGHAQGLWAGYLEESRDETLSLVRGGLVPRTVSLSHVKDIFKISKR